MPVQLPDAYLPYRLSVLNNHADYLAAKRGDEVAALKLAQELMTYEVFEGIVAYAQSLGLASMTVLPVIAVEATGYNKIPLALAKVIERRLGWPLCVQIFQAQRVHRTQMDGLNRLFHRPAFSGAYDAQTSPLLLLDDTLTQGGTFAALEAHATSQGLVVGGAMALTGKLYSAPLRLDAELLDLIEEKYDDDFKEAFAAYCGYDFRELTQSEARALANADVERVRACLFER